MKKFYVLLGMTTFLMSIFLTSNAQSWTAGTGKLYSNPTTTKIGIGISAPAELLHINSGSLKIGKWLRCHIPGTEPVKVR